MSFDLAKIWSAVTNFRKAVVGKKTYIALAFGMVVIAANRFGLITHDMLGPEVKPENWLVDEYKLLVGTFIRSALPTTEGKK